MNPTNEKPVDHININNSHWYTSEIFKVLFYPVFIVLLSIGISHYFWIKQFENTRNQQFLDMKIKAFENYSLMAARRIQLSEYYNRIHIEKIKLVEEITYKRLDESKFKNEGDVVLTTLNSKEQDSTLAIALKKEPKYAEYYQKYLDFQNEVKSNTSIVVLLFGPSVRNEVQTFEEMFTENEEVKQMCEQQKSNHFSIKDVDVLRLMIKMSQDKDAQLTRVLFEMSNEIYGE